MGFRLTLSVLRNKIAFFLSLVDLQQSEKLLPRLVDCESIARFDRSTMGHLLNQVGIYSSFVIVGFWMRDTTIAEPGYYEDVVVTRTANSLRISC